MIVLCQLCPGSQQTCMYLPQQTYELKAISFSHSQWGRSFSTHINGSVLVDFVSLIVTLSLIEVNLLIVFISNRQHPYCNLPY